MISECFFKTAKSLGNCELKNEDKGLIESGSIS